MKAILLLAIFLFSLLPIQIHGAINTDWCDKMYDELFFKEVPDTIQKECSNRFIWNVNREKSYFN